MNRGKESTKQWAKRLVQLSLDNGLVSEERVQGVLQVLEESPPRNYKQLLKKYLIYIQQEIAKNQAIVEYSGDVSPKAKEDIKKKLADYYKRDIQLVMKEVSSLLAGFRIKVADDVWDLSVQGRLNKLAEVC